MHFSKKAKFENLLKIQKRSLLKKNPPKPQQNPKKQILTTKKAIFAIDNEGILWYYNNVVMQE